MGKNPNFREQGFSANLQPFLVVCTALLLSACSVLLLAICTRWREAVWCLVAVSGLLAAFLRLLSMLSSAACLTSVEQHDNERVGKGDPSVLSLSKHLVLCSIFADPYLASVELHDGVPHSKHSLLHIRSLVGIRMFPRHRPLPPSTQSVLSGVRNFVYQPIVVPCSCFQSQCVFDCNSERQLCRALWPCYKHSNVFEPCISWYLTGFLLLAYIYAIDLQELKDVAVRRNIAKDTSWVRDRVKAFAIACALGFAASSSPEAG